MKDIVSNYQRPPLTNNTKSDESKSNNKTSVASPYKGGQSHELDQPADNVYHQILPEDYEDGIADPKVLPIHFNYNFIEREKIPLHNEKYSKTNDDFSK